MNHPEIHIDKVYDQLYDFGKRFQRRGVMARINSISGKTSQIQVRGWVIYDSSTDECLWDDMEFSGRNLQSLAMKLKILNDEHEAHLAYTNEVLRYTKE
jgi:hypothetical protein